MHILTKNETPGDAGSAAKARGKISTLLIDDEPDLTDALKAKLEATGRFHVHVENSSVMGLETAARLVPQIIILDVCMPILDGGDVLARLEVDARLKDTKIIMLSSLISHEETNEEGFIRFNGTVLMAKPVCVKKLVACVEKRLSGLL